MVMEKGVSTRLIPGPLFRHGQETIQQSMWHKTHGERPYSIFGERSLATISEPRHISQRRSISYETTPVMSTDMDCLWLPFSLLKLLFQVKSLEKRASTHSSVAFTQNKSPQTSQKSKFKLFGGAKKALRRVFREDINEETNSPIPFTVQNDKDSLPSLKIEQCRYTDSPPDYETMLPSTPYSSSQSTSSSVRASIGSCIPPAPYSKDKLHCIKQRAELPISPRSPLSDCVYTASMSENSICNTVPLGSAVSHRTRNGLHSSSAGHPQVPQYVLTARPPVELPNGGHIMRSFSDTHPLRSESTITNNYGLREGYSPLVTHPIPQPPVNSRSFSKAPSRSISTPEFHKNLSWENTERRSVLGRDSASATQSPPQYPFNMHTAVETSGFSHDTTTLYGFNPSGSSDSGVWERRSSLARYITPKFPHNTPSFTGVPNHSPNTPTLTSNLSFASANGHDMREFHSSSTVQPSYHSACISETVQNYSLSTSSMYSHAPHTRTKSTGYGHLFTKGDLEPQSPYNEPASAVTTNSALSISTINSTIPPIEEDCQCGSPYPPSSHPILFKPRLKAHTLIEGPDGGVSPEKFYALLQLVSEVTTYQSQAYVQRLEEQYRRLLEKKHAKSGIMPSHSDRDAWRVAEAGQL